MDNLENHIDYITRKYYIPLDEKEKVLGFVKNHTIYCMACLVVKNLRFLSAPKNP
ncbi:MAG: hypothetical protein KKA64_00870 [Nanoarchaeota archaeon]|nr:hypothetical protein [Nanoarchaeota archaeon]